MNKQKRGMFIVVFSIFLLVLAISVSAEESGCFLYKKASKGVYCTSGILKSVAVKECKDDCDITKDFQEGKLCNLFPECKQVFCDLDCLEKPLGLCQEEGGKELSDDQYQSQCEAVCCVEKYPNVDQLVCNYPMTEQACKDKIKIKPGIYTPYHIAGGSEEDKAAKCQIDYCKEKLAEGSLEGVIKDVDGPVSATISLIGKDKTDSLADGKYSFPKLDPGTYPVEVSKEGYQTAQATISIGIGEKKSYDFTLNKLIIGAIVSGVVKDAQGQLVDGATVLWKGTSITGSTTTSAGGKFSANLPEGKFTFTANKVGFEQGSKELAVIKGTNKIELILTGTPKTILSGTAFLDKNSDNNLDANEKTPAVQIFIDGKLRASSQYEPLATYSIVMDLQKDEEQHSISATYLNGEYVFGPKSFKITKAGLQYDVLLKKLVGVCTADGTDPQKKVDTLNLNHLPGEIGVKLSWIKPCPEVEGYEVERKGAEGKTKKFIFNGAENSYVDKEGLEWLETYEYKIRAVYKDGGIKYSDYSPSKSIKLGQKECEGRYLKDWETFCEPHAPYQANQIYTCSNNNVIIPAKNCPPGLLCAPSNDPRKATCMGTDACFADLGLFGLQSTANQCYGIKDKGDSPKNFCYYDQTHTIVDSCKVCLELESCFDYKSKGACEINNCLTKPCEWVDAASNKEVLDYSQIFKGYDKDSLLTTKETGAGYCIEEKYDNDDKCSLCSSSASLLENFYCTAEVCTGLGRCFSNPPYLGKGALSSCNECGESPAKNTNCYTYGSKLECEGESPVNMDIKGKIIPSADNCNWGTCRWIGNNKDGKCVKDADVDKQVTDDCQGFKGADKDLCKSDNTPPKTSIVGDFTFTVSSVNTNVTLEGDESINKKGWQGNHLGVAGICLTSASSDKCLMENFVKKPYPGLKFKEEVTLNLYEQLKDKKIDGEIYLLKYFSQDRYFNQENVQEAQIYVDNVPPEFTIKSTKKTLGDTTDLSVFLEDLSEAMSCDFELTPLLPLGTKVNKAVSITEQKMVSFPGLKVVRADVKVTCKDSLGNENSKNKTFVFDLEKRIEILSPELESILSKTTLTFEVKTTIDATCSLFNQAKNQKVADFKASSDLKIHKTDAIPGFIEGDYSASHKVICTDVVTQGTMEDFFNFRVDFTPPNTEIILKEGKRVEKPVKYGWEEFFVKDVEVTLSCKADGFSCEKRFYCLGKGCGLKSTGKFVEYTAPFKVDKTTSICYFSKDKSGNEVVQPFCGKIIVEGYGLILESPPIKMFEDEIWGISNKPQFELRFTTKVSSKICKLGLSEGFDYDKVDLDRVLEGKGGKYIFPNFPSGSLGAYPEKGGVKTLYVVCEAGDGGLSPEHVVHIEYDPSAPEIIDQGAEPNKILKEKTTRLFATTDDKTFCRYSDNSAGDGSSDYLTMEYSFPGQDKNTLFKKHEQHYSISFVGLKKDYLFNVQCKNGADDFSKVEEIKFEVDYTEESKNDEKNDDGTDKVTEGFILKASPQGGYLQGTSANLFVETSKNAICRYKLGSEYQNFNVTGEKIHTSTLLSLPDKDYLIPVSCIMGKKTATALLSFTIDTTAPSVISVEDGNYTCGSKEWSVMVETSDNNISGYYYEIYDNGLIPSVAYKKIYGEQKSTQLGSGYTGYYSIYETFSEKNYSKFLTNKSKEIQKGVVYNKSVGPTLPLSIPVSEFKEDHIYYTKVWTWDAVKNQGNPKESDGIAVVQENSSFCVTTKENNVAPKVDYVVNDSSCLKTVVKLKCSSPTGCKSIEYGISTASSECQANKSYNGKNLLIKGKKWVCYTASDYTGINVSGKKLFTYVDQDGDSVRDKKTCDLCLKTPAGKIVGNDGCSLEQLTDEEAGKDEDKDGLPDSWEKLRSREGCLLSPFSKDSDGDGVDDATQDYDDDGRSNLQEYYAGTDPCVKDDDFFSDDLYKFDEEEDEKKVDDKKKDDKKKPTTGVSTTKEKEEESILALILMLIGLLLILGGTGYLVYYYLYSPQSKKGETGFVRTEPTKQAVQKPATFKEKFFAWKKKDTIEKSKEKKRKSLFGQFSKSSSSIPPLEKALKGKGSDLSRLGNLAQHYSEHKEEIRPGLRKEEKNVFSKLDKIAGKTKDKKIHEVVSKDEAKDIFGKLKDISKKRKKRK